jgi:glycosyltransferase involved in cell wall biosynthesis
VDRKTGILVEDSSAPAFADGIARALSASFDRAAIRRNAERFSRERFLDEIAGLVSA